MMHVYFNPGHLSLQFGVQSTHNSQAADYDAQDLKNSSRRLYLSLRRPTPPLLKVHNPHVA